MTIKSPASRLFTQPFIQTQIKKTSKLRVTGLCAGNSPGTGEFPAQMASDAENVSIDDVIMDTDMYAEKIRKVANKLGLFCNVQ